jgi:hypothetical protein
MVKRAAGAAELGRMGSSLAWDRIAEAGYHVAFVATIVLANLRSPLFRPAMACLGLCTVRVGLNFAHNHRGFSERYFRRFRWLIRYSRRQWKRLPRRATLILAVRSTEKGGLPRSTMFRLVIAVAGVGSLSR